MSDMPFLWHGTLCKDVLEVHVLERLDMAALELSPERLKHLAAISDALFQPFSSHLRADLSGF